MYTHDPIFDLQDIRSMTPSHAGLFVTPLREATDHRPKEVDRRQRIIGTQTERMVEAQYQEVAKKVGAHAGTWPLSASRQPRW